jgi:retron-type reverse transcriptase
MALHAKAKAEAGYRFYALYDKISREDILAHAYAQCRSNKGAPGVDGQDFVDIDAYGVERWLGELALALRQETYRPEPIRRVFILKANGKLRPLGISTLRDRVCMTAAMLVLEPILEADQLWLILGDGVNQAADFASGATSIPSWNLTRWMTFGNWF